MDTGFMDSQMYKIKQGCVGFIARYNMVDNKTANSTFTDEQKKIIFMKYGEMKTYAESQKSICCKIRPVLGPN